jgi:acyl-CoA thioester hydrolase
MTYAFEIQGHPHDGLSGDLAAFGTVTVAHVPRGSAKAQPWPAAVVEAVAPAQPAGADAPSGDTSSHTAPTEGT